DACADLPREERVREVVSALFGRPAVCGDVDFNRDARLSAADVSAAISLQPIPTATATEETTKTATATKTPEEPRTPTRTTTADATATETAEETPTRSPTMEPTATDTPVVNTVSPTPSERAVTR